MEKSSIIKSFNESGIHYNFETQSNNSLEKNATKKTTTTTLVPDNYSLQIANKNRICFARETQNYEETFKIFIIQ